MMIQQCRRAFLHVRWTTDVQPCSNYICSSGPDGLRCTAGTFAWSAPEVLLGTRTSEKADIFSYGVILWEIVTGAAAAPRRTLSAATPLPLPPVSLDMPFHHCHPC